MRKAGGVRGISSFAGKDGRVYPASGVVLGFVPRNVLTGSLVRVAPKGAGVGATHLPAQLCSLRANVRRQPGSRARKTTQTLAAGGAFMRNRGTERASPLSSPRVGEGASGTLSAAWRRAPSGISQRPGLRRAKGPKNNIGPLASPTRVPLDPVEQPAKLDQLPLSSLPARPDSASRRALVNPRSKNVAPRLAGQSTLRRTPVENDCGRTPAGMSPARPEENFPTVPNGPLTEERQSCPMIRWRFLAAARRGDLHHDPHDQRPDREIHPPRRNAVGTGVDPSPAAAGGTPGGLNSERRGGRPVRAVTPNPAVAAVRHRKPPRNATRSRETN